MSNSDRHGNYTLNTLNRRSSRPSPFCMIFRSHSTLHHHHSPIRTDPYDTTTKMEASTSTTPSGSLDIVTSSTPKPIAASNGGRSIGKAHKSSKSALKRSYISPSLKTPFEKRKEKEQAQEAVKAVEQEMKEHEEAEKSR
jgi:hypothetical protein